MDQSLFVKIFVLFYILFCGLIDMLSSFNFRWSDNFKVNKYFGQFSGMHRLVRYESAWQQCIQILSAFIIMPCFILVFVYTMNPELESIAIPFGIIAASILLGCKSLQMCELAKYNFKHVWIGYMSIFIVSFISLFIINYLGKDNISGVLSFGIFISVILFPWVIVKLTNNRDYEYDK